MDNAHYIIDPLIDEKEARIKLQKRKWFKRYSPQKVKLYRLPGYLFQVDVRLKDGTEQSELVFVDGFEGELSFIQEVKLKEQDNVISPKCSLTIEQAKELGHAQYQRQWLWKSLKTKIISTISKFEALGQLDYPFWIGFFKNQDRFSFSVIDAVGGGIQGMKTIDLFSKLILLAE